MPEFVGSSLKPGSRSRKGAWIEILIDAHIEERERVAPVRERGLKYPGNIYNLAGWRRSRKGAWIEMFRVLGKS